MNIEVIEKRIKQSGLKKSWVAEQIGVHPATLRRFLNGKTELGLEPFARLLTLLNLKLEALMESA